MIIGVPKEIKREEYRVGITPAGVKELRKDGHTVLVEESAGQGSGFADNEYLSADADIVLKDTLYQKSHLIVKVKEPLPAEFELFRERQALFTFLHLAPNWQLTNHLLDKEITAMGYETLEKSGGLPLLAPMSEIAGRMAPLMASHYLQMIHGGAGILSTGTAGVKPAKALILGGGVVGSNAARVCIGLGMDTVIINNTIEKLKRIDELFMGRIKTLPSTMHNIEEEIRDADIIIGAVLVPGAKTPVLVNREMLRTMKKGSVIVDVAVDQGGCFETSMPSTHDKPVYQVEGIIHYTVANMPGAYPRTSTLALTNATLPYIKILATMGIERAVRENPPLRSALNIYRGNIVHRGLAQSIDKPYKAIDEITEG
jgi:alanine dehydrogenase